MKLIATAVFAMFLGLVSVGVVNNAPVAAAQKADAPVAQPAETTYDYVAQNGDSFSLIARKAVQTYGKKFKVELGFGQILFAETHLTQAAGSPQLNAGDKVSIKESAVKSWVEKAQKLSTAVKAAWQVYAQHADFDTDKVGQN